MIQAIERVKLIEEILRKRLLFLTNNLCTRQKIKCSNFVILAKAGIHAGSEKKPLEEMDSRIRGKDNDILVMYRDLRLKLLVLERG